MKASKEFWDKSASRYAKSRIRDEEAYRKKLAITQEYFQPDWRVLEFGCGTGSTAIIHAPYVNEIVATDLSEKMLEIAEQRARDAGAENVSFQQGTLESLDCDTQSFDAVLGLNVLHLIEDVEATASRVNRLLKPGGIFVSSTALVGEISFIWRLLIPLMQRVGLAPYVNALARDEFVAKLTNAGFSIEREWRPNKSSIFIIAQKHW